MRGIKSLSFEGQPAHRPHRIRAEGELTAGVLDALPGLSSELSTAGSAARHSNRRVQCYFQSRSVKIFKLKI